MEYVYIYSMSGEISIKAKSKEEAEEIIEAMSLDETVAKSSLVSGRVEFCEAREESDGKEED